MIISFPEGRPLERVLNLASAFTLIMSLPQVLSIWVARQVSGVSLLSWASYLVAAILWLIHGVRRRDRSIYIPCIGWIAVDLSIVIGILVFRT